MAQGFMIDTNVFNDLRDGRLRLEDILPPGSRLVVTHVQRDELAATASTERRASLLACFHEVAPEKQATGTAVWGVSRWGEAKWAAVPGRFEQMLAALDARKKKPNNVQDVLIAETALALDLVLASSDGDLRDVFELFGGTPVNTRKPSQTPGA